MSTYEGYNVNIRRYIIATAEEFNDVIHIQKEADSLYPTWILKVEARKAVHSCAYYTYIYIHIYTYEDRIMDEATIYMASVY